MTSCLAAAPISQWTNESWFMMIAYMSGFVMWMLNVLFDNQGGQIHKYFLYFSEFHMIAVPTI